MVYDCIVPSCKNYSNCKPNIHFHGFPFGNQTILEQWVRAINRPNWTPTKRSKICSDHFTQNDYPAPQLRKLKSDVVPSLLLPVVCDCDCNCVHEKKFEVQDVAHQSVASTLQGLVADQANQPVQDVVDGSTSQESVANQIPLLRHHLKKEVVPSIFSWTKHLVKKEEDDIVIGKTEPAIPINSNVIAHDAFTFNHVKMNDTISIPPLWEKINLVLGNICGLLFRKTIARVTDNKLEAVTIELLLYDDLRFAVKVLNKAINNNIFGVSDPIKSIYELESLINLIEGCNVCVGCIVEPDDISIKVACKESNNIWRHRDCPLLLSASKKQCKQCKNIRYSINKKRKRFEDATGELIRNDNVSSNIKKSIKMLPDSKNKSNKKIKPQQSLVKKFRGNVKRSQDEVDEIELEHAYANRIV